MRHVSLPQTRMSTRAPRLQSLTGVRFFAALWVVFCHFSPAIRTAGQSGVWSRLALAGHLGVPLFFILSGFILAHNYAAGNTFRGTTLAFYVARIARLYPAYLFALVVAIGPFLWWHDPRAALGPALLGGVTLTQAWSSTYAFALNGPAWSLSCEGLFYVAFPFLLPPLLRISPRQSAGVAVACVATSCVVGLVMGGSPAGGDTWTAAFCSPVLRLPQFLLGIAMCRLWAAGVRAPGWDPLWTVAAVLAAVELVSNVPSLALSYGPIDALFALLIWQLADGRGIAGRLCATRALVLLGEASYSVYLLHYPLWDWLARFSGHNETTLRTETTVFPAYLVATVLLSIVVYRYLETPARRWLVGRAPRIAPGLIVAQPMPMRECRTG